MHTIILVVVGLFIYSVVMCALRAVARVIWAIARWLVCVPVTPK
jgi:hypothetical protein